MKIHREFHGQILPSEVGRELRKIIQTETEFKILTGYGSSSGLSASKRAALSSLRNMKKEKLIKAYFPGEIGTKLLKMSDSFYNDKLAYEKYLKNDDDFKNGNDGIIFIFVK